MTLDSSPPSCGIEEVCTMKVRTTTPRSTFRAMGSDTIARWQFGITTVYHYFFVPVTIALSLLVAILQTQWYRTGSDRYLRLTKFYGKLFLINFAMGVVTGIVQEFQFGMNWSEYSRFVGDIFGAPLALEALVAFFLESTCLGLWIFGWDKLSRGKHLAMIWLASAGTLISSIFIMAANSWMQNPVGATYNNGRAELVDFGAVLTNPIFLAQWPHTVIAAFMVAGGFIAGVAGWHMAKLAKQSNPDAEDVSAFRTATKLGAIVMLVAGVLSILAGEDTVKGINDIKADYAKNGFTQGDGKQEALQKEFAGKLSALGVDPTPNIPVSYWSFRIMMGLGFLTMLIGAFMLWTTRKGAMPKPGKLWTAMMWGLPLLPLFANSFGWIFTEMGRQPWIVAGVMPTAFAVSPTVSVGDVWFSMIVYTLVYGVLAVVEVGLMLRYIRKGLPVVAPVEQIVDEDAPLSFAY